MLGLKIYSQKLKIPTARSRSHANVKHLITKDQKHHLFTKKDCYLLPVSLNKTSPKTQTASYKIQKTHTKR